MRVMGKLKLTLTALAGSVLCLVAVAVVHPPKAHAFIWPPGNLYGFRMPVPVYNYLDSCDAGAYTPAFQQWISIAGQPTNQSITVPYGTSTIWLDFNWNGAVCKRSSGSAIQSSLQVVGANTPGANGIVGAQLGLVFGFNAPVGTYSETHQTFTYSPPGGFTRSGTYIITLATKSINQFPGGFICVENSPAPHRTNSLSNFAPCNLTFPSFPITVIVQPRPPIGQIQEVSCNQIVGYAFDPQAPSQPIRVSITIDGNLVANQILANINRPDVQNYWAPRGYPTIGPFHGFAWPDNPVQQATMNRFRDTGSHLVQVWAVGTTGAISYLGAARYGPCYNAACSIRQLTPAVKGQSFGMSVTFTNNGAYPWQPSQPPTNTYGTRIGFRNDPGDYNPINWRPVNVTSSSPPIASVDSSNTRFLLSQPVPVGSSVTINFTATAPNSVGNYRMDLMALIENHFWFGQKCGWNVTVYGPFVLVPQVLGVDLLPTDENPSSTKLRTNVTAIGTPAAGVLAKATRTIYWKRGGLTGVLGAPFVTTTKFKTLPFSDTTTAAPPGGWQAGDQVCGRITVDPGSGLADANGNILTWPGPNPPKSPGPPASDPAPGNPEICITIVNEPYVSVFGNDVFAGGDFNPYPPATGTCANPNQSAKLLGFYDSVQFKGAGVQFAAAALGTIDQFASASLRTSNPQPPKGLTFANTGGTYGVDFGGGKCITNFYGNPPAAQTYPGGTDVSSLVGSLGIGSPGSHVVVYVDGDAKISGNITLNSGPWASPNDIPTFNLIAKGNILIKHSVTQLDGIYIAQPPTIPAGAADTMANGGQIYTCVDDSFSLFSLSALYSNCNQQLVVNGAFISKATKLQRTYCSLRYSKPGAAEYSNPAPAVAGDCPAGSYGHAAEVFNYSPETYVGLPPGASGSTSSLGKYDYITSLPPVL